MKVVEEMYMTDEQFATYNKLIELVEVLIEKLPDHEKEEFRQKKNDILLKKNSAAGSAAESRNQ